jgi:hypothetical protein
MRTVNRLYALGSRHFMMVHDSYGVHAADVDLLHRVLREEFAGIYSEPVVQKFIEELRKANPGVKLPDPAENRNPGYPACPFVALLLCVICQSDEGTGTREKGVLLFPSRIWRNNFLFWDFLAGFGKTTFCFGIS